MQYLPKIAQVSCHVARAPRMYMHAEELKESVGSPVRKTQAIEGFGNACSEAETTAKNIKKKTKAEPVFVVVTGDPDPMHDIPCPPAAEKQYQCGHHVELFSLRSPPANVLQPQKQ